MDRKARIAHLAGPNATIQNTPPLVTSNKARAKHNLPLLVNPDSTPSRFDVLRPQRLAAPVTVYVEQYSGHPLEADAAELYGPPDGYVDSAERAVDQGGSALAADVIDRPYAEGFVQFRGRHLLHRAGGRGATRRRLGKCRRCRGMEGDVALDFLDDLACA